MAALVETRLWWVGLLALAVRLVLVLCVFRSLPLSDQHNMFGWEQGWIARSIYLGRGFSSPYQPLDGVPTALVAPLYPYLLALIFSVFGLYTNGAAFAALALNALISATIVFPVFGLARTVAGTVTARARVSGSHSQRVSSLWSDGTWVRRLPWIAATLWALYPFSVYYSGAYLWDCTLTGALFAWTVYTSLHLRHFTVRGWAFWGLLYGVTALCNPCVLSLFPALVLIQVIGRGMRVRQGLLRIVTAAGVLVLALLPWSIRNVRVLHAPVPLRDGFWGEFYAGNTDDTSRTNPGWTHPGSNPAELRRYEQLGEVRYMAEKQELGLRNVTEHPGRFAVASLRRVVRFWTGFWSFTPAYLAVEGLDLPNVPLCTLLLWLMLVGMRTLLRQHRRVALSFLAIVLVFPLPYYLTHASMDYRQPIEPEIVVLVTLGGAELWRRRQLRRAGRRAMEQGVLVGT